MDHNLHSCDYCIIFNLLNCPFYNFCVIFYCFCKNFFFSVLYYLGAHNCTEGGTLPRLHGWGGALYGKANGVRRNFGTRQAYRSVAYL